MGQPGLISLPPASLCAWKGRVTMGQAQMLSTERKGQVLS